MTLTQGTIITGVRSQKYQDVECLGIVISARCDLANCKTSKVFYLAGLTIDNWLLSDQGFKAATLSNVKSLGGSLNKTLSNSALNWEVLKGFSAEEFDIVIRDPDSRIMEKQIKNVKTDFDEYKRITKSDMAVNEKQKVINQYRQSIIKYLTNIINGKETHLSYMPENAYISDPCPHGGLIIDLEELEYIPIEVAEILERGEMDIRCLRLNGKDKERFNEKFFLKNPPGFALAQFQIASPWVEYLMQKFSNSFIRIGVNGPTKEDIEAIVDNVCKAIQEKE